MVNNSLEAEKGLRSSPPLTSETNTLHEQDVESRPFHTSPNHEKPSSIKANQVKHSEILNDSKFTDPSQRLKIQNSYLLKIDLRLLPAFALLFLFSFLDRTNIGKLYN